MIKVTKRIEKILTSSPLYSKDGQGKEAKILLKIYIPFTSAEWLITEARKEEDDWLLFGYCHIQEWEFGYVSLNEINSISRKALIGNKPFNISALEDTAVRGMTINEYLKDIEK